MTIPKIVLDGNGFKNVDKGSINSALHGKQGGRNLSIDLQMDETHVISSKQTHHTSKHILLQQQYIKWQTHRKCILSSKRQVVHCSGN